MEQLPGILLYFCVAILVPIVLAWFVVRAEWRTVRNTCLIWYGFLLLAFGSLRSQEVLGGHSSSRCFSQFWMSRASRLC
jgi:hypothetical protein